MDETLEGKKNRFKKLVGYKVCLYLDNNFSFEGIIYSFDMYSGEVVLVDPCVENVEKMFLYASDIKAIMLVKKTLSEAFVR